MKVSNMNIPYNPQHEKQLEKLVYGNKNNGNICCRDPFIMPYGGKYYFYQTATERACKRVSYAT